jgi:hypothetical protein
MPSEADLLEQEIDWNSLTPEDAEYARGLVRDLREREAKYERELVEKDREIAELDKAIAKAEARAGYQPMPPSKTEPEPFAQTLLSKLFH